MGKNIEFSILSYDLLDFYIKFKEQNMKLSIVTFQSTVVLLKSWL